MLKFVTLFALVAAALAEPEADPQWLNMVRYSNGAVVPQDNWQASMIYSAPRMQYAAAKYAYPHQYMLPALANAYTSAYSWPYASSAYRLHKREADSEAFNYYTAPYSFNYNNYAYMPYAQRTVLPATYAAQSYNAYMPQRYMNAAYQYAAYPTYGSHALFKREAEAEPEAQNFYAHNAYPAWNNYAYMMPRTYAAQQIVRPATAAYTTYAARPSTVIPSYRYTNAYANTIMPTYNYAAGQYIY